MSSIQFEERVIDLDPRAAIRHPLHDCSLTRGLFLCLFSYFGPFLGLELFGRDDFSFLNHIFTLLVSFPFLICRLRWRSVDGKESWRSGLDGHPGDRSFFMRFEELKQAGLWLPL